MAAFSKPNQASSDHPDPSLPAKRKRTINPKLISEDNVHEDAVKKRKLYELEGSQVAGILSATASHPTPSPPTPYEVIEYEGNVYCTLQYKMTWTYNSVLDSCTRY
jgi:hypothetical protein